MNLKQQFVQFLIDNDAYDKFLYNYSHTPLLEDFMNNFTVNGSAKFITKAFSWGTTKEGSYFWAKLSVKWKKRLFKYLLPYIIKIIKKHNLYGNFIINAYNRGKEIKTIAGMSEPYDYPYTFFKDTNIFNTPDYNKMHEEWFTITLKKIT